MFNVVVIVSKANVVVISKKFNIVVFVVVEIESLMLLLTLKV